MILPLTHDRAKVSTFPWVSVTLIALAVLVHLASIDSARDERIWGAQQRALEQVERHPYLDVDHRLLPAAALDQQFGRSRPVPDDLDLAAEQAELDRLTAAWLARLGGHPAWRHGLVPSRISAVDLLSHLFLHAGWLHLFGNMLLLYLTGPFIEDDWGALGFAGFYLLAGALAGGLYALAEGPSDVPLIGASGAVSAVLGAFLVLHGATRIKFLVFLGLMVATFSARAWLILPLWFVHQILSAMREEALAPSGGGGIAYLAHVVGFALGLGAAVVWRRRRPAGSAPNLAAEAHAARTHPLVDEARRDLGRGLDRRAWSLIHQAVADGEKDRSVHDLHWDLALHLGCASDARDSLARLLRDALRTKEVDRAEALVGQLADALPDDEELGGFRLRLASQLMRVDPDRARPWIAAMVREDGARLPPASLPRLVRLADRVDPELGRQARDLARSRPDLPPDVMESLGLGDAL